MMVYMVFGPKDFEGEVDNIAGEMVPNRFQCIGMWERSAKLLDPGGAAPIASKQ
jgi:hypothetical protein